MVKHEGVFNERHQLIYVKESNGETILSEEIYNYLDDGGIIEIKFNSDYLTKRVFNSRGSVIMSYVGRKTKQYDYWDRTIYSENITFTENSRGWWYCLVYKDNKIIEKYSSDGAFGSKLIKFG